MLVIAISYANNSQVSTNYEMEEVVEESAPARIALACLVIEGNHGYEGMSCVAGIGSQCKTLQDCKKIPTAGLSLLTTEERENWPETNFWANDAFVSYMLSIGWFDFEE